MSTPTMLVLLLSWESCVQTRAKRLVRDITRDRVTCKEGLCPDTPPDHRSTSLPSSESWSSFSVVGADFSNYDEATPGSQPSSRLMAVHLELVSDLSTATEAEAVMNSHPLTPLDSSPTDGIQVLTPGHFLIGRPLQSMPEKTDVDSSLSLLQRWNLCQLLSAELWRRWSKEYLHLLNRDNKWKKEQRDFTPGDIVLLRCSNAHGLSQGSWRCILDQTGCHHQDGEGDL